MAKRIHLLAFIFLAAVISQSCKNCKEGDVLEGGATAHPITKALTDPQIAFVEYAIHTDNADVKSLLQSGKAWIFDATSGGANAFRLASATVSASSGITIEPSSRTFLETKSGLCPDMCDLVRIVAADPLAMLPYDDKNKPAIDKEINDFANGNTTIANALMINPGLITKVLTDNKDATFIIVSVFAGDKGEMMYQGFQTNSSNTITATTKPYIDVAPTTFIKALVP